MVTAARGLTVVVALGGVEDGATDAGSGGAGGGAAESETGAADGDAAAGGADVEGDPLAIAGRTASLLEAAGAARRPAIPTPVATATPRTTAAAATMTRGRVLPLCAWPPVLETADIVAATAPFGGPGGGVAVAVEGRVATGET